MVNKKIFNFFIHISYYLFLTACSSSGPVSNDISEIPIQTISPPNKFISPIDQIETAYSNLNDANIHLNFKKLLNDSAFIKYLELYDIATSLEADQALIENELAQTGELVLAPGKSYSFDLESFCVHAGKSRPIAGDGFKIVKMKGNAQKWLPDILNKYHKLGISQEAAQNLIWAILSDVRFDELSRPNQKLLLKIFPDARIKFGYRNVENMAENFLGSILPNEVNEALGKIKNLHKSFLNYQSDVSQLIGVMAPVDKRKEIIPIGWMKTIDGYFIQITSKVDYSQIHIDIFVPEENELVRTPSSITKLIFRPSEWIALPGSRQRLAISPNSTKKTKRKPGINICDELKKWKPSHCEEISSEMREKILALSDPKNFPKTRYVSPPKEGGKIEEETDCSHFVQEIYKRAKLEFHYSPAATISCLQVFKEVTSQEARPGDLVLYRGHVGILNKDGMLISSTVGGEEKNSTLDPNNKKFRTSITILPVNRDFGIAKYMTWRCKRSNLGF